MKNDRKKNAFSHHRKVDSQRSRRGESENRGPESRPPTPFMNGTDKMAIFDLALMLHTVFCHLLNLQWGMQDVVVAIEASGGPLQDGDILFPHITLATCQMTHRSLVRMPLL